MRRSWFALYIVAAAFLLWGLGSRGLNEPDEGRVAGIGYEMYRSGDLIIPTLYDRPAFNKPPLVYWLLTASYDVFGVNEFAARLPAATAAFLTLILAVLIARRLFDNRTALFSGWILLSSPVFFAMSRIIDYNMVLTFWVTLATWSALAWIQDDRPLHRWIFYIALGFAFLTKGPVGPVIVCLGLLGYRFLRPAEAAWRPVFHLPGFVLFLGISLPWFLHVTARYPELWQHFIGDEIINRVASDTHQRSQPFGYYFLILPAAVLPWLPAFLRATLMVKREWKASGALVFLASAVAFPFILFSLSTSKLPTYILPLLPATAILIAATLIRNSSGGAIPKRQLIWATLCAAATPAIVALLGAHKHGWDVWFTPWSLTLWAAVLVAPWLVSRRQDLMWPVVATCLLLSFHLVETLVLRNESRLEAHTSSRIIANVLKGELRDDDRLALLQRHPRGLRFYLQREMYTPVYKFTTPVKDDSRWNRFAYNEPGDVFRMFADDSKRMFVVTNRKVAHQLEDEIVKRPIRTLLHNDRFVVVSNERLEDSSEIRPSTGPQRDAESVER